MNNNYILKKHCTKSTFYAMFEQRGITLISLIVTIIVLLILAGVTIANITGGEAPMEKAQKAKDETAIQAELQKLQSIVNEAFAKGVKNGDFSESTTLEDIKNAIKNKISNATLLNSTFPLRVNVGYNKYLIDNEKTIIQYDKDYIEKEYLKSTGTQYIDTNYYSNAETRVKLGFSYTSKNNDQWSNGMIFGSANSGTGYNSFSIGITLEDKLYYRNSNQQESFNSSFIIKNNDIYDINIYQNNIYANNSLYTSQMNTITNTQIYSSYLFARHHSNVAYSKFKGKIYYCKIYDGDTLKRDFIPVVSLESGHENEPCLYDKVEGKFYYNQGTGTFETN